MADTTTDSGSNTTLYIGLGLGTLVVGVIGFFVWKKMSAAPVADTTPKKKSGSASSTGGGASDSAPVVDGGAVPPMTGTPIATGTANNAANASANGFVSDAAVAKRRSGNYATYNPQGLIPAGMAYAKATPAQQNAYNAYIVSCNKLLGTNMVFGTDGGSMDSNEKYASAFLQGMSLAQTPANLTAFVQEIKAYIANPSHILPWESLTTGQFMQ